MQAPQRRFDRLLLKLDEPPIDPFYRAAIGYVALPLYRAWGGESGSDWWFVVWFLGVLLSLRLIPAVVRHALPFSRELQSSWFRKRHLAKRFDSYQWRKLFWIGTGLSCYVFCARDTSAIPAVLAAACLASGLLGMVVWWRVARTSVGSADNR